MAFGFDGPFACCGVCGAEGAGAATAGAMFGMGKLKVGAGKAGATIGVTGVETALVGTSTVCWVVDGGCGRAEEGCRKVFLKSSLGGFTGGKTTKVATMTKTIKWSSTAPKK
jgi:hypothetical protein